ncbi:MAG: hypothetical protein ACRBCT_09480 [Alphaproteobacteria bacterium]
MTIRIPQTNIEDSPALKAWVVFSGQADLLWLKLLKPGFRHCYVILNDGNHWVSVDPLSNYTDVSVHNMPADFDLPRWMQSRGHTILPAEILRPEKQAPWMPFSCVEAVKRILGIHKHFMLTPWNLYRYLQKQNTKSTFDPKTTIPDFTGELAWEV